MAATPQSQSGDLSGDRRVREDELDREVQRRAEHVAEEESDPMAAAREEQQRQGEQH